MMPTLPQRAQFIDDAQLRTFIAASGMGLWRFDHATRRFARDAAFLSLLGMPADTPDCTLEELLAMVHPEDRLGARAGLEEMCAATGEPHDAEYRLRCHDGNWLWVRMQGHVVQSDPAGRPQLTIGLMRSIARFKLLDKQLEKLVAERTRQLEEARGKAEAANRAKSTFLSNMSHEIRTPLNAIIGLAHLLEKGSTERKQREQLRKIGDAGGQLLEIISDILDLAKIESGRLAMEDREFALHEIFDKLHALIDDRAAAQGLLMGYEIPAAAIRLRGDPTRIEQILLNFASNAVKFTERGSITLAAVIEEETPTELALRFEVRDTGIGMRPELRERIFLPFEQADDSMARRFSGAGLGLAISSHLARMMGGALGVESQLGIGSTFWFRVRLCKGMTAAGAEEQPRPFAALHALRDAEPAADAAKLAAFADVPGLDTVLGLHSVRGRTNSYLRLLRLFYELHADDLPAMRRCLAAGLMEELQRLAHSLKGTTATLGASRLRALAAELETRVKERQDGAAVEAGIAALEVEWREFAPPLAAALACVDQAQPDRVAAPGIDRDALHATIDRIEALLADDDMAVNDEYRQAADLLQTCFGTEVKQFEARLKAFDYSAALEWLRARRAEREF